MNIHAIITIKVKDKYSILLIFLFISDHLVTFVGAEFESTFMIHLFVMEINFSFKNISKLLPDVDAFLQVHGPDRPSYH
jgi:hypothetical protein